MDGPGSAYKAAHESDADALLAERGHIDNSHAMIDSTLEYVLLFPASYHASSKA